jgi:hypothetical protein
MFSYVECVNCKNQKAVQYLNNKTKETHINCIKCGYHKRENLIKDSYNIPIGDGSLDEHWEKIEITDPFGSFQIEYSDSDITQCGVIINESDFEELINKIFPNQLKTIPEISNIIIRGFVDGEYVKYKLDLDKLKKRA